MLEFLTDIRAVALVITAVEGACLIYLRRIVLFLEDRRHSQRLFVASGCAVFMGLAWLFLARESTLYGRIVSGVGLPPWLFVNLVRDFFFTVTVAFDFMLLYYGIRILMLLQHRAPLRSRWLAVVPVTLILAGFWAFYAPVIDLFIADAVDAGGMARLSDFYRRICGTFFVVIESAVAAVGYLVVGRIGRLREQAVAIR